MAVRFAFHHFPLAFLVNGIRHDGPWDADSLTEALVAAAGLRAA